MDGESIIQGMWLTQGLLLFEEILLFFVCVPI